MEGHRSLETGTVTPPCWCGRGGACSTSDLAPPHTGQLGTLSMVRYGPAPDPRGSLALLWGRESCVLLICHHL